MKKGTNSAASSFNEDSQKRQIFKALHQKKQPLSRREISIMTGCELPTLCRLLWDAVHTYFTLEVAHFAPCKFTGRRVMHYYFRRKTDA